MSSPPSGAPSRGAPPAGAPPAGASVRGAPPWGAPSSGVPPWGAPPSGVPPWGASVRGNRWDEAPPGAPARDAPPRSVSVVVAHYEQPGPLARTLAALGRQRHPAGMLEVIVADDGSAAVPDVPAGVLLVRQDDRGFRAAAVRNLGAAAATGDVLVFLDADTTPEPGFVSVMSRLPSRLPEAVVVGRRRHADLSGVPAEAPIETAGPEHELPEPAWLADGYRRSRDLLDADDRSYRYVISAVLSCSRWFFDEVGGFDETFVGYGGEDWEWAHRAWLAGAVLAHEQDAVAWHDGPDWSGRSAAEARTAKTAETLRLSRAIAVAGSRPRGLRSASPDIVVDVAAAMTPSARFVTVDALLEALPEASIVVPDAAGFGDERVVSAAHAGRLCLGEPRDTTRSDPGAGSELPSARVTVRLEAPVAFLGDSGPAFAAVVRSLGTGERGGAVARTADGGVFAQVESSRAAARRRRWGAASGFDTADLVFPGAVLVGPAPNVEAWLGRWAGPAELDAI